MTKIQPLLQRGLTALDPWLDAVFPVATALICARQRLAGYSLLVIYLSLRLLQRSDKEPWRWILISLLVVNAGLIIEDRDVKPGGPSDYLIVALSFGAGFERSAKQWSSSLAWISLSIIPLLALSLAAGDTMIQRNSSFTGFNINRLGFLAGILSIFSYSLLARASGKAHKTCAFFLLAACASEAILTLSRAAIAVPCIAIAIDQAYRINWNTRKIVATTGMLAAITVLTLYTWYGPVSKNNNKAADDNRIATIQCWAERTIENPRSLLLGQGYDRAKREKCGPKQVSSIVMRNKPLSHAHNLYVQLFAETGISGLILLAALTFLAFQKAHHNHNSDNTLILGRPLLIYLFLMAIGATWHTMMLNQVLVGYSLAALTAKEPDPSSADAATPPTQPT